MISRTLALAMLVIAVVSCSLVFAAEYGPFRATVARVIDGDTLEATINLWPDLTQTAIVRLAGIDAPELHGKTECERSLALKAQAYLESLADGKSVTLTILRRDKYAGRYDGRVLIGDLDVSQEMIKAQLVRPYSGGAREPWCQ